MNLEDRKNLDAVVKCYNDEELDIQPGKAVYSFNVKQKTGLVVIDDIDIREWVLVWLEEESGQRKLLVEKVNSILIRWLAFLIAP